MYSFVNDYSEGAHQAILDNLIKSNMEQSPGYGEDEYTQKAKNLIKSHIKNDKAEVHLVVGGTQVNLISICAFLRPHEAVIAVTTGHICVHEAGAIEAVGHRIVSVEGQDGKLYPENIQSVLDTHIDYHMVKPKLVYISNSTEVGTVYTLEELKNLSAICKKNNLILYIDGARLGSALTSETNQATMADVAKCADAFYIGGTKNGALFGEALVITNPLLQEDFKYFIKQKGALLAKGRLLGIQFATLFENEADLFYKLARHSNIMANKLQQGFTENGFKLLITSTSNQVFVILPKTIYELLSLEFKSSIWEPYCDDSYIVRFVTSWATPEKEVDKLIAALKKFK
ncbi:threonine aldolase [Candidatus Epulonipiscium fishelsonii]|uniref:Threonine aldolase n=1 Tax=Candidatus Epulonipiscium fishelsonii TaxID=77094 RepID=A0ACC8XCF7_9FIRM|nr:threonine aldolase [Epulopiscium sp. SCG-D08WGA-EpuloA1]